MDITILIHTWPVIIKSHQNWSLRKVFEIHKSNQIVVLKINRESTEIREGIMDRVLALYLLNLGSILIPHIFSHELPKWSMREKTVWNPMQTGCGHKKQKGIFNSKQVVIW